MSGVLSVAPSALCGNDRGAERFEDPAPLGPVLSDRGSAGLDVVAVGDVSEGFARRGGWIIGKGVNELLA